MYNYTGTISILKNDIEKCEELKNAVREKFYDSNGELFDNDNWEEDSPIAYFKDIYASFGHFEQIETICQKHRIPYDRWSEAYIEDSMTAYYRPDVNATQEFYANGEGDFDISEYKLKDILNKLKNKEKTPEYPTLVGKAFLDFMKTNIPQIKSLYEYETTENK